MAHMIDRENCHAAPDGWHPFRVMDALLRWDPFADARAPMGRTEPFVPRIDVKETKDGYVFCADIPGVKDDALEISVTDSVLSISGRREQEHRDAPDAGERYCTIERAHGEFTRSFQLPASADLLAITAELKDGVLAVHVPKKAEVQPRKIPIAAAGAKA